MKRKIYSILIIFITLFIPIFFIYQCPIGKLLSSENKLDFNNKNYQFLSNVRKANCREIEIDFSINNSLVYESHINKLKMDWGKKTTQKYLIYYKQNITSLNNQKYNINESFDAFISNPDQDKTLIDNFSYRYTIDNVTNIPIETSITYPEFFIGGWHHNFPEASNYLEVNFHEISYMNELQQSLILKLSKIDQSQQEFNGTIIDTNVFNANSAISQNCTQ